MTTLLVLIQILIFYGGLFFWPWARSRGGFSRRCIQLLKLLFILHILLHIASLLFVAYCRTVSDEDWPACLIFTYLIGLASAVSSMLVIIVNPNDRESE